MTIYEGKNIGVALGLVFAAGAASTLGAAIVFFPKLVKFASPRFLAGSLGLSAGVMIYVSFVEILMKSVAGFIEAGFTEEKGYIFATFSFFGGVLIMKIIELCIKFLSRNIAPIRRYEEDDVDIEIAWNEDEEQEAVDCFADHPEDQQDQARHPQPKPTNQKQETQEGDEEDQVSDLEEDRDEFLLPTPHYCVGCDRDPLAEIDYWHEMADRELQGLDFFDVTMAPIREVSIHTRITSEATTVPISESIGDASQHNLSSHMSKRNSSSIASGSASISIINEEEEQRDKPEPIRLHVENVARPQPEDGIFRAPDRPNVNPKDEKRRLSKMGVTTALAIILHNFPEGLATFVAALQDPSVGAVLAIAIALHNLPEGVCIALPIYYATGNRWKAFGWGCLAGIAEPIAAVLGVLVLATVITDEVYAILFGLVSGMMVMISLRELIPAAHRYDPEDTCVTMCLLIGMAVMGLSLVLFEVTTEDHDDHNHETR